MTSELEIDLEVAETIGLGDEDAKLIHGRQEWFKGEKGRTDRIALINFATHPATAVRKLLQSNRLASIAEQKAAIRSVLTTRAQELHKPPSKLAPSELLDIRNVRFQQFKGAYKQDVGFVEVPAKILAAEQDVWGKLGEPRCYMSTLVLVYRTDRDGEVDHDHAARGWRVMPWRFTTDKYELFRRIDKGLSERQINISDVDLYVTCTDSQFQKMTITQAGSALYRRSPEFVNLVLESVVAKQRQLRPFRQLTTEELREKLGMPAAVVAPGSDLDTSDLSDLTFD